MKKIKDFPNVFALTKALLAFNTVNPPGNEAGCARFVGNILAEHGFAVRYVNFADGRPNVIAWIEGASVKAPLCFSGHLDTVPFDSAGWRYEPLGGHIEDGKIFGRGAADMKGGVAAMVVAALRLAETARRSTGMLIIFSVAEETGCQGARFLASCKEVLRPAGCLVVGEPTGNYPLVGHKGKLWIELRAHGMSAHGSMPEQGDNAIFKAARAVVRLKDYFFEIEHSLMGRPTLNVGTIHGGTGVNIVPDKAVVGVDIRIVPGQTADRVMEELQQYLGSEVVLAKIMESPSVFTEPNNEWIQEVFDIMANILGERPSPRCATYLTDAAALVPALGFPPAIILGPGEPDMAHKTDEHCATVKIEAAVEAYYEIGRRWFSIP